MDIERYNMVEMLNRLAEENFKPGTEREPREKIIEEHRISLKDLKNIQKMGPQIQQSYKDRKARKTTGLGYRETLSNFQLIGFDDLILGTVHHNKHIAVRNVVPAKAMTGLHTVVEDMSKPNYRGERPAIRLSIYNFLSPGMAPEKMLPIGTQFIIINPYYKIAQDMLPRIRCDNPEQIIMVSNESDLDKEQDSDSSKLKERGNTFFANGNFVEAIKCYTKALNILESDDPHMKKLAAVLYSNRAAAHLTLKVYSSAHEDALSALWLDPDNSKAKYRVAKALFGLCRYEDCTHRLRKDIAADALIKPNSDQHDLLRKAVRCTLEQESGRYDFITLYREAATLQPAPKMVDHAEYFFGGGDIVMVPGKGRGVVATRDIKAGTLIAACKALEVVFSTEAPSDSIFTNINPVTKEIGTAAQTLLATKLIARIQGDQRAGRWLYDLSKKGTSSSKSLPLDISFLPKIPPEALDPNAHITVDVETIDSIISTNSFAHEDFISDNYASNNKFDPVLNEMKSGSGVWLFPAYINHSCLQNVGRYFIGDIMFLRAHMDIPSGSELTLSYLPQDCSFKERQKRTRKRGFICDCTLCYYDRVMEQEHPGLAKERAQLEERLKNKALRASIWAGKPQVEAEVSKIIHSLRRIHKTASPQHTFEIPKSNILDVNRIHVNISSSPPPSFILEIFSPLSMIGRLNSIRGRHNVSAKYFAEIFWLYSSEPSLAFNHMVINVSANVACELFRAGDHIRAKKWMIAGTKLSDKIYGGGIDLWKIHQAEASQELNSLF